MDATTVGVDLAKTVFQLTLANAHGRVLERRRLSRAQWTRFLATQPPRHVVMEACGTAHYWGRVAQGHGHTVTLLPPAYVRPYVRRSKTDQADADALLEALRSGEIHPVAVKRVDQQALIGVHRIRRQWMTTRTARLNLVRGLLRELGLGLPAGAAAAVRALPALLEDADVGVPEPVRRLLAHVYEEIRDLEDRIADAERQLRTVAATDPVITHLQTIPGIGLLTATALVGSVGSIHAFRRARQFASWVGLTPHEHSSGARRWLGGISKRGDRYLRYLLTHGARAVVAAAHRHRRAAQPLSRLEHWAVTVTAQRGYAKATVAVANKLARTVWAVWHHDVPYTMPAAA